MHSPMRMICMFTLFVVYRYLNHYKKVVRNRSVFEDNQVDPEALQVCLASVVTEDISADAEEADEEEEQQDQKVSD